MDRTKWLADSRLNMAQVHIRLSEEDKEEWKEYAEEEGYGSLSRFIRTAVKNERGETNKRGDIDLGENIEVSLPDNVATADEMNRATDTLLQVVDRLEEIENRMEKLERDSVRPQDTQAVIESLPTGKPTTEDIQRGRTEPRGTDLENADPGTAFDGTPVSVATLTDESVAAVEHFLAESAQRTDAIRAEQIDGKLRYWKVENHE